MRPACCWRGCHSRVLLSRPHPHAHPHPHPHPNPNQVDHQLVAVSGQRRKLTHSGSIKFSRTDTFVEVTGNPLSLSLSLSLTLRPKPEPVSKPKPDPKPKPTP